MKAIGYRHAGRISAPNALIEFEAPDVSPRPRDLVVEVRGISVNPVDVKLRGGVEPDVVSPRILGFDGAGVVTEVGSGVSRFAVGDEVYYAGDLTRTGTNAEFHCVDESIVGRKPKSLPFSDAAGIPLTAITAWEILFDSFGLTEGGGQGETLLVIGGAGGVGSILVQLAKQLTNLSVVASASRDETRAWVTKMGADHVVNHRRPLDEELARLKLAPRYVASLTNTADHLPAIRDLIAPRGHLAVIDDPNALDIIAFKQKSVRVAWEFMFTRSMYQTRDMDVQHRLLNQVAAMLDEGLLVSTVSRNAGSLTAENLKAAHEFQESGRAIGKTVLDGFH